MNRSASVVGLICAGLLVSARPAQAQSIELTPAHPKRWDVSVHAGWLSGNQTGLAEEGNDWYDTFAASVEAGRYWTTHFKTEIGGTFTSEDAVFSTARIVLPPEPAPVFYTRRHHVRLDALTVSAGWQFLENTLVHPFVSAGVHVGRERMRTEVPFGPPFDREGRPIEVPLPAETTTIDVDARPFVTGGAKFYVSEHGFFRTDLSVVLGSGGAARTHWRAGFGVDF